jgi:hypothetical protein
LLVIVGLLGVTAFFVAARPAVRASSAIPDDEAVRLMFDLTHRGPPQSRLAMQRILYARDTRFIAVFIELLRGYVFDADRDLHLQTLQQLSGQRFGRSWPTWVAWYGTTNYEPPPRFLGWKGELFSRIDPEFKQLLRFDYPTTLRVEEIVWGGVPFDGIYALDNAPMIPAAEGHYLMPDEPVFGLVVNGEARAYPLRIMDQHEMANDVVGGEPVSIAYCTLCGAGIAYRGTLPDGEVLTFGSSGLLYRSNKLMYDRATRTLWNQLTGEPVLGPMVGTGIRLEVLPLVLTTWSDWQAEHPETLVLSYYTGFGRQYQPGIPYGAYFSQSDTMFPVAQRSELLPTKSRIFAIYHDGRPKAYPLDALAAEPVVNDVLGNTPVVVLSGERIVVDTMTEDGTTFDYAAGAAVRAYTRGAHTFMPGPEESVLLDEARRSWQVTEVALVGPRGETLERLGGHLAYWFGWYAFFPQTEVYGVE